MTDPLTRTVTYIANCRNNRLFGERAHSVTCATSRGNKPHDLLPCFQTVKFRVETSTSNWLRYCNIKRRLECWPDPDCDDEELLGSLVFLSHACTFGEESEDEDMHVKYLLYLSICMDKGTSCEWSIARSATSPYPWHIFMAALWSTERAECFG